MRSRRLWYIYGISRSQFIPFTHQNHIVDHLFWRENICHGWIFRREILPYTHSRNLYFTPACLLGLFGLLSLLILICFAWLIFEPRAVNLLALVWLELARLVLYLAYLLPCPLTLLCLLCVRCLVCLAWADCAWLARSQSSLCSLGPSLTWLCVYSCGLACSAFKNQAKLKLWKTQNLAPNNNLKSIVFYIKVRKSSYHRGFWFFLRSQTWPNF